MRREACATYLFQGRLSATSDQQSVKLKSKADCATSLRNDEQTDSWFYWVPAGFLLSEFGSQANRIWKNFQEKRLGSVSYALESFKLTARIRLGDGETENRRSFDYVQDDSFVVG